MSGSAESVETRERLLAGYLSRQGVSDALVVESINFLMGDWPKTVNDLIADRLLAEMLRSFPIFPGWFEFNMTATRRQFLVRDYRGLTSDFLAHLAIQCHLNEYAWAEDATETSVVDGLAARLIELTPDQVMQVACYRPLASLPGADALLSKAWIGPVQDVLREQVTAVREEQAIAADIPSLGVIRNEVSQGVRAQYEVNPYPRWRRAAGGAPVTEIHGRVLPKAYDLLVAGCGTGRHAIDATLLLPGAKTLAIDLSRASLAYAIRKTRELGLEDRITYAQADILEIADSGRTFDMVQSAGVLHHMADPFEGARAVSRMVKPGGLLALGLYSVRARKHLDTAKALGKAYTPETVREFRQAILNAPGDGQVHASIVNSRDFYATSGCRDLLMHVQEHQHTIADLQRMMNENGLEFLGFHQFQQVKAQYQRMFPHDPKGRDLAAWDKFEIMYPETFVRMYQFWAAKLA